MTPRLPLLALPLALGACVQSVNPLYTDASSVSVPALAGTWMAESGDLLVVTTTDSTTYALTLLDQDGEVGQWIGRVTMLGGRRWLDVAPAALPSEWSEEYRNAHLPLHQFWALQRVDSVLVAAVLSIDSLKALIERTPTAVAHTRVQGTLVLTAETADLRAFLATFAERPGVLEEGETMRRVPRPR